MALPSPLPDNPHRWDGWRHYNSQNPYERLCLSFDANPSTEQIEENCRQLLVWWQKKLPLKNQPSNPIAQMLRAGLDEAAKYLVEARTELLDPERRTQIDEQLHQEIRQKALAEFHKFFAFAVSDGFLTKEDETSLRNLAKESGLQGAEVDEVINAALQKHGAERKLEVVPQPVAPAAAVPALAGSPADQFRQVLRLSGLDEDGMTDDQRDALCNMGENLGLTGGQAEDLIDEYLDHVTGVSTAPALAKPGRVDKPAPSTKPIKPPQKAATVATPSAPSINISPLARAQERRNHPNFVNSLGMEMFLVTSGVFSMGSNGPEAAPNEQPIGRVLLSCYYMSRFVVTNAQYEKFDPSHRAKRAPWADDHHPVVYVSSLEAIKFCDWLSIRDKRKYRLPTEAEWEFAARGPDGRTYPWGEKLDRGDLANFADVNTSFPWADPEIDDGYAQTAPIGTFPRGASPFGIEGMSGNVWEWCQDFYELYKGKDRINPKGNGDKSRRVYRGGSWKSRASSLRTTCRGFNTPNYSANDVSFRLVCECA